MLEEFSHFHPNIVHLIKYATHFFREGLSQGDLMSVYSAATDVTCWPLSVHKPFHSWFRGKVVLIGDAAHPVC